METSRDVLRLRKHFWRRNTTPWHAWTIPSLVLTRCGFVSGGNQAATGYEEMWPAAVQGGSELDLECYGPSTGQHGYKCQSCIGTLNDCCNGEVLWLSPSGPLSIFRISEGQLPQNHVAAIGHLTMKNVESFTCLRRRKKSGLVLPRRFFLEAFSRNFPKHLFLYRIPFDSTPTMRSVKIGCWTHDTKNKCVGNFRENARKKNLRGRTSPDFFLRLRQVKDSTFSIVRCPMAAT